MHRSIEAKADRTNASPETRFQLRYQAKHVLAGVGLCKTPAGFSAPPTGRFAQDTCHAGILIKGMSFR